MPYLEDDAAGDEGPLLLAGEDPASWPPDVVRALIGGEVEDDPLLAAHGRDAYEVALYAGYRRGAHGVELLLAGYGVELLFVEKDKDPASWPPLADLVRELAAHEVEYKPLLAAVEKPPPYLGQRLLARLDREFLPQCALAWRARRRAYRAAGLRRGPARRAGGRVAARRRPVRRGARAPGRPDDDGDDDDGRRLARPCECCGRARSRPQALDAALAVGARWALEAAP
ncbi:MAG: hypothetical protein IRZ04_19170 [Rhodospirillales bacterium]|nr:hypothetical protein [Rhodospirillales bacterium]